jgi:hypothetical protein
VRAPTRADLAPFEAVLEREGLGALEVEEPRARTPRSAGERGAYADMAAAFLDEHAFANAWDREVWALHAGGFMNPKIVGILRRGTYPRAYLRKVQETILRLKKLMLGKISTKRGRGRPRNPDGRDRICMRVVVRLTEVEAGRLFYVEDKLRAAGVLPPVRRRRITVKQKVREIEMRDRSHVLRLALQDFARRIA